MTDFQKVVREFKFAANSKVAKLLKSGKATDAQIASACKTTKAYKEYEILRNAVETLLAKPQEKSSEPERKNDQRSAEPRRYY